MSDTFLAIFTEQNQAKSVPQPYPHFYLTEYSRNFPHCYLSCPVKAGGNEETLLKK